jgi:hypothetical protein
VAQAQEELASYQPRIRGGTNWGRGDRSETQDKIDGKKSKIEEERAVGGNIEGGPYVRVSVVRI